jgi:hypothetical protein
MRAFRLHAVVNKLKLPPRVADLAHHVMQLAIGVVVIVQVRTCLLPWVAQKVIMPQT